MKMFIGNLSHEETENALRSTFAAYGVVEPVTIETHRQSGLSRGFGFVEMSAADDGERAVAALNGNNRNGRLLTVSVVGPHVTKGGVNSQVKRRY
ncbi:MAG: RNA-binding protein [Bryobacteraceae bacterium]|nr:RNA-binding protein [Bryobacteraceae bacterium]